MPTDISLLAAEAAAAATRGRLFVHAGAVAHRGRALVLPGSSGWGKSTLTAGLLADTPSPGPDPDRLDRRRFLVGAAAAASLVTSILVPTAAMAQSANLPNGSACTTSSQCSSGCCRNGRCKPGSGNCS